MIEGFQSYLSPAASPSQAKLKTSLAITNSVSTFHTKMHALTEQIYRP